MLKTRNVFTILILAMSFIFYASTAFSKQKFFPNGCRNLGYEFYNNLLILKPMSEENYQTLYFIHNSSSNNIRLKFENLNTQPYIPSLENTIKGGQWAALAMDRQTMRFRCEKTSKEGKIIEPVNCVHVLKLCQFTRAKFGGSTYGNYWVVDSASLTQTRYMSIAKGILLRW